jgi:hypothetical protein
MTGKLLCLNKVSPRDPKIEDIRPITIISPVRKFLELQLIGKLKNTLTPTSLNAKQDSSKKTLVPSQISSHSQRKMEKYMVNIDRLARNFIKKITPELRKIRFETVEEQWNIRSTRDFFYVRMCGLIHALYWHLDFGDLADHLAHNLILSDPPLTTTALNALGDLPNSEDVLNNKVTIFQNYYKKDRWNDSSILWHNLLNRNFNILIFNKVRKRLERKVCRLCFQRIRSNMHYLDWGRLKEFKRFSSSHRQIDVMKEDITKTYKDYLGNLWKKGKRRGYKINYDI